MFADTLAATIAVAPATHLDHLARTIWKGHAAGALSDAQAQAAAEAVHARRRAPLPRHLAGWKNASAGFPRARREPRSADRARSMQRRRRNAMSGPMPPGLACKFTVGEAAVLAIVAGECRLRGRCDRSMGEIAARAGVCIRLARAAIREAERLGLVTVEERRISAFMCDTNIVRIVDRVWLLWLGKKLPSTGNQVSTEGNRAAKAPHHVVPTPPWRSSG